MNLTFGSLFAGVGGFDLGFEKAGWECSWQVEWDNGCQAVLRNNWPDIPKYFDVCDVDGSKIEPVDLITFGSPCQDLSIAGKRAGLDGNRSSMFFEATRIIQEMRNATGNVYPKFAVWENVTGALTSNKGQDFAAVIDEMANIGALAIEWHILDAQWFGIPHRRRRVFLVACFDSAIVSRSGQQILPVPKDSKGNLKQSRKKRKQNAGTAQDSDSETLFGVKSFVKSIRSGARDSEGNLPPEVWVNENISPTLNAFDNTGESRSTVLILDGTRVDDVRIYDNGIMPTLKARMGTGGNQVPMIYDNEMTVRRLTPVECERLLGFPDNHTKYGMDGKTISDTNRYKMLGNAVAVPVSQWVGKELRKLTEYCDTIDRMVKQWQT